MEIIENDQRKMKVYDLVAWTNLCPRHKAVAVEAVDVKAKRYEDPCNLPRDIA